MIDVNYQEAPNFTLDDLHGNPIALVDYKYKKNVLLVFNRSFY